MEWETLILVSKSSLCAFVHYGIVVYGALVAFSCNSLSAGNTQLKSTVKQGESHVTEVKNKNVYNLWYSAFDPSLKFSNGMTLLVGSLV